MCYRHKMRTYTRKKLQVQEIEDVQSLCRLCLGKTLQMISIFDTNVNDIFSGLPLRIGSCLGLEVSRDDVFPKFICQACNTELERFFTFKKNCFATYRKLKATLFAVKNVGRKKDNVEYIHKNTTSPGNSENTNEIVQDISLSLKLSENEQPGFEIVTVANNKKIGLVTELNREKQNCHTITGFAELTECSKQPAPDDEGEDFGINNQLVQNMKMPERTMVKEQGRAKQEDVSRIQQEFELKVGETRRLQPKEDKEGSKNMKTTECLPAYIVTALAEQGMLAKKGDGLEILDQSVRTFNLESACGSEIVMELVEEEPCVAAGSETARAKLFGSTAKNDALVRHARVHSGEKPFACRACGRRFAQREVLRRHQLLHQDKLPYQCARCPKAYTQRGALEAHARSHAPAGERPLVLHRCTRCPKVFLYPSGLSRHMSVHQGRDYPCDECSRTFTDKSSLQRHRRGHQRRAR